VRNFKYRSESDCDQRWETRSYNLDGIHGVDLFLLFWGPTHIAHTIASWEFDDGQHLAISIETCKEEGESYSAIRGFFHQYKLYYVVADERDVVGLRTNYRGEQVYLYRIRVPASQARALLVDYLDQVNRLADHPQWYNALTQNCTTTIHCHAQTVGAGGRLEWRLLANGHLDELLYERGQIDTDLPFADLRARSNITEKAKAADDSPDFSARIRQASFTIFSSYQPPKLKLQHILFGALTGKRERERLHRAIAALKGLDSSSAVPSNERVAARMTFTQNEKGPGPHLTPAGRKRLSEAMKQRWADRRKKGS